VAENLDATANHNYSNYTTDTQDLYGGWDPVKTTTLKYGTTVRLDNMPSDHFSIAEPRKHFPSAPSERGYHGYSYAWDSTSFHGDIGIVFANMNAKLHCRIANNNIFTNVSYDEEDDEEEEDEIAASATETESPEKQDEGLAASVNEEVSPSFITRARLLVVRKFTITGGGDNPYKFTIK
jgi:hypothetical protein